MHPSSDARNAEKIAIRCADLGTQCYAQRNVALAPPNAHNCARTFLAPSLNPMQVTSTTACTHGVRESMLVLRDQLLGVGESGGDGRSSPKQMSWKGILWPRIAAT